MDGCNSRCVFRPRELGWQKMCEARFFLESFAEQDERLVVYRNERRLGIPRAWNRVMALALEEAPAARYAAWAGDHDRWANGWLGRLADALDACSGAALAVPLTRKIAVDGTIVRNSDRRLDTRANTSPTALVRATVRDMTAGDQIYGLFRRRALEHALPVPHVVLFDRLVLASIALEGPIVQVDDHLWERRTFARPIDTVLDREREAQIENQAVAATHDALTKAIAANFEAIKLGAREFLTKPYDMEELVTLAEGLHERWLAGEETMAAVVARIVEAQARPAVRLQV